MPATLAEMCTRRHTPRQPMGKLHQSDRAKPSTSEREGADLLQRGVAGALADAVDGALELTCSVHGARQCVACGQTQVVLAVRGDDHIVRAGRVGLDLSDQLAELGWNADAHLLQPRVSWFRAVESSRVPSLPSGAGRVAKHAAAPAWFDLSARRKSANRLTEGRSRRVARGLRGLTGASIAPVQQLVVVTVWRRRVVRRGEAGFGGEGRTVSGMLMVVAPALITSSRMR
jgi:hypothetical protein